MHAGTLLTAERLPVRTYTSSDGLVMDGAILQIMQDSRGFLWFVTGTGISRFDGQSFRNHDSSEGLPSISRMLETFSSHVEDAVTRIHQDDGARVALAIARVLSGEAKELAEQYRIVRPEGSTCWIDAQGVMLQDDVLHMMGVGVDITGLKAIQRSLEESEEKYLLLLNSTAEAIYGLDLNGLCTFCNPACLRLLGYEKRDDLLGKIMHKLMHHTRPDGTPYPIEECDIYRAIREGVPSHLSGEVLWKADGSRLFVECWSHPMFRNGEPVGAVVTFLDLTERRRAEDARRSSEAQYRELFENATYGIVVTSQDGTLVDANPAVIRMLGYGSKEELIERNLQRDIEPWGTSEIGARECEWVRKDGKTIAVHLSSRAIRGPDGAVTQTQVIATFLRRSFA
jgi:PAS domain S-box-containing protein